MTFRAGSMVLAGLLLMGACAPQPEQVVTNLGHQNLRNLEGGMSAVRRLLPDSP